MSDFEYGDKALLIGPKCKKHLITLQKDDRFCTHRGYIDHSELVASKNGEELKTSRGFFYKIFRPTYIDYIKNIERKAQIIYPVNASAMMVLADVYPGLDILEAGIGQGALSISILRALGEKGKLVTYEIRDDFISQAKKIISDFLGDVKNHEVVKKDIYQGIEGCYDRVFLDVPEPWQVVDHLNSGLVSGGFVVAHIPTILQVKSMVDELRNSRVFTEIEALELLKRPWRVKGRSVRPEDKIRGHTGFIVKARKYRRRGEIGD